MLEVTHLKVMRILIYYPLWTLSMSAAILLCKRERGKGQVFTISCSEAPQLKDSQNDIMPATAPHSQEARHRRSAEWTNTSVISAIAGSFHCASIYEKIALGRPENLIKPLLRESSANKGFSYNHVYIIVSEKLLFLSRTQLPIRTVYTVNYIISLPNQISVISPY